jgi:hypothetical protein
MKPYLVILICAASALAQDKSTEAVPPLSTQVGPVAQETADKAKALVDQMIRALGGDAYLNLKDVSQQGRSYSFFHGQPTSTGVPYWRFTKYPDKERIELTKKRDVIDVFNGIKGYEITYKGTAMLEAKLMAEYLRRRDHSLDVVLRRWLKEPGVVLLYEGTAIAASKPTDQITVLNASNDSVTLYIDNSTHLPVKKTYSWRDPTDKLRNVEDEIFDAYRPTEGIMTPYSITRFYNGEMSAQRFLSTVQYNQALSEAMFEASANPDSNSPAGKK